MMSCVTPAIAALLGLTGVYVWLPVSPDVWEYTLVFWQ